MPKLQAGKAYLYKGQEYTITSVKPQEDGLIHVQTNKKLIICERSDMEEFLPVANAQGIAVIAMKVLALAKLGPYYERSLRYSMSLPVSTIIVGMESMEQLQKNLAVAEQFTPLTDEERLEFYKEIIHLATPEVMRWKTQDYFNPVAWEKRTPPAGTEER